MSATGAGAKNAVLSPEQALQIIALSWVSNGTGAVATATTFGRVGVVTRRSAGQYTIQLTTNFKTMLGYNGSLGNVARNDMEIIHDSANTNVANGNIQVQCYQAGNGIIDPPTGAVVYLTLIMGTHNSTKGA